MPEEKTLNEDLFYKGSSANLPRLHTCKNKVSFWDFNEFAVTVTKRTISNEMLRNGLKSRTPKKTPLLLKRNRDARLKFVRQHKEKDNSFWERVLVTDETKIELFGHNYRNHVCRKDGKAYSPKNMEPTVKFGSGSIMIWGCFSAKGVGKISVIDGKMNVQMYKQILQENLMSYVESLERLLITFSSRIMIPSNQLNLRRVVVSK